MLGINEFIDLRRSFFCLFTSSMATSHENSTHVATSHKLRRVPLPAIQSTARPSRAEALCKLFVGCRQSQKFSLIAASRYRLRECTTPLAIRLLAPTRCYTHIVAMSDAGEPNRLNRFLTAVLARFQAAQTPWFPCTKKHKATGPTFFRSRRTSGERCHPRRLAHRGLLLQPRAKSSLETEAPGCW